MLRKQWQDYALKAKQIAKHIVTGLEQNKKGVRLIQIVYGLDMYATDALNLKYSKQRSKSSVHTYQGGRQEISTQHADGSEGLFKSNGEFQPTNNPMDTEVEEYMNNNLDENKQYKINTNMNKKLIRLTEADLHRIVKESVNRILNEIGDTAKGQYMLGRLQGRQMGNGNRQQAMNTQNYASKQLGSRTPQNFQTYDAAETANQIGYNDERNPQHSQDMMTNGGSIGNYQANVRNNYLRGVSKF